MEKAPDAFRTISEVAEELDVPQHVLRFWETRFSQIRPLKRAGGRRYYRPEDVDLLRRIREHYVREVEVWARKASWSGPSTWWNSSSQTRIIEPWRKADIDLWVELVW